jgi:hypothetical protein
MSRAAAITMIAVLVALIWVVVIVYSGSQTADLPTP